MSSYETDAEMRDVRACIATINERVENCRERSLAVTKLEEAVLWLSVIRDRQEEAELDAFDTIRSYGENA